MVHSPADPARSFPQLTYQIAAYNNTKKLSDLPIDPIILFWPKKDTHQRVNNLARAAIERFSRDTLVARARANAIEMIYEGKSCYFMLDPHSNKCFTDGNICPEIRGRISNLRSQMAKLAPRENTKSRSGSEATKHDNELLASPNEEFCARNEQLLGRIEQIDKDKFYLKGECASSEKNILLLGENVRSASFPVGLVTIMIRALML